MSLRILQGEVTERLCELPAESVHCVVTSPPYWGLRDYGTGKWEGGDPACPHKSKRGGQGQSGERADRTHTQYRIFFSECGNCGAKRVDQQIGLEPTPDLFIQRLVEVFREVRRVLRSDGTLWVNIGDSYANDGKWGGETGGKQAYLDDSNRKRVGREKRLTGLKPKDLVMIPARLALALQADGWYLRSDIIWAKPNPMPESVTDRPTKAHEYVFLLSKSADYFYDDVAIREPQSAGTHERFGKEGRKTRDGSRSKKLEAPGSGTKNNASFDAAMRVMIQPDGCRNKRSVWTIATQAFPEAHFATFPEELAETCIKAGSSERGCCAACGAPWERIVERVPMVMDHLGPKSGGYGVRTTDNISGTMSTPAEARTTGWKPGCECGG